jgi:CRP/FNR family cyclic AMP-dependent transcriptional regulator
MSDRSDLILASALGAELTSEEAEILDDLMSSQTLVDGDFLITESVNDDSLHVLLQGKLEVVKKAGAGETASLAVLHDGELAGELSFIDGEPHTVSLRALCDCVVLSLARKEFEAIVDKHPQLVYKVMRAVARSAHRIVHRMNLQYVELSNYVFKQHGRY